MIRRAVLVLGVIVGALFLVGDQVPNAEALSISNIRLVSQDTGKCLDVVGGGSSSGTPSHLWQCLGVSSQNWEIIPYDATWHKIKRVGYNLCLDVPGAGGGDIQLQQYTCNNTDAQKFTVPSCALCWGEMRNKASNKCVDVQWSAVGDGTVVWQYGCNQTRAQMWTPDTHDAGSYPGPQEKRLFTDRWYQFYEDSGNYTTWMTLSTERHYASSGYATNWSSPITGALGDWNNAAKSPNTVFLSEVAPNPENDVHVAVTGNTAPDADCFTDFGVRKCTGNALGITYSFDEVKHECQGAGFAGDCDGQHSKPNTWWYVMVLLDDDQHTTSYQRQETTAHELGHAIGLAHDSSPADGEQRDFVCGTPRTSVMDYDCALDGKYDGPQLWDSCGVNHAYYDPNWGFSGC